MTLREIIVRVKQTQTDIRRQEVLVSIILDLTLKQIQMLADILETSGSQDAIVFLMLSDMEKRSEHNQRPN